MRSVCRPHHLDADIPRNGSHFVALTDFTRRAGLWPIHCPTGRSPNSACPRSVCVEGELRYREFVSKKQKKSKNGEQKIRVAEIRLSKIAKLVRAESAVQTPRTPLRALKMFVVESREHSVECRMVMSCRGLNPSKSVPDLLALKRQATKKTRSCAQDVPRDTGGSIPVSVLQ